MKLDIKIFKEPDITRKCVLCLRKVYDDYYRINIEYENDKESVGHYRELCNLCHCALKKHFTGVD